MRVDLFDFALPDELIALRPAEPREAARLLAVPPAGPFGHRRIGDLPSLLRPDDVLVLNDTRVIPARLRGTRARGDAAARIEVLLHRRLGPDRWRAFARPAKRLAAGDRIRFGGGPDGTSRALPTLDAEVEAKDASGGVDLRFGLSGPMLDEGILARGEIPLPPYIESRRPADAADARDYQTVYAREAGAVAAPTAGLHLTHDLIAALQELGIAMETLTLHVGAGTFLPVKAEDTRDHRMHAETGLVSPAAAGRLNAARSAGRRIVAVGTTSLRLLESAARPDGTLAAFDGPTDIFITPGYGFRTAEALLTNFHLPRSTLFMLVAAFSGLERIREAYGAAIAQGYRFYSYGDACLLERGGRA